MSGHQFVVENQAGPAVATTAPVVDGHLECLALLSDGHKEKVPSPHALRALCGRGQPERDSSTPNTWERLIA